jgi:SNF2 family DNA or RNA helicase
MQYESKTTPYAHQQIAFEKSWQKKNFALFMEMGTGKTKVAVDTFGALFQQNQIDTVLIFAPKGVYDNWFSKEIPQHLSEEVKTKVVRWQPSMTKKFQETMRDLVFRKFREPGFLHILVMNIEAMSTTKGATTALRYLKDNPNNMLIVDESTTVKNSKAIRTKNVVRVSRLAKYRRILTGSPITRSPLDLFSQCEVLDPELLGFKNFYTFRNRYAVIRQRSLGPRSFQEVVGYQRLDELNLKIDSFSERVLKEDCLDLPKKIYMKREVEMTGEQKKLYKQMKKLALAQFDNGELSTTQSVLTQIMRLQQIVCGHLQPDDGTIQPIKNNRLSELLEAVDELQGKAIIWATWTHDVLQVADALRRRFGDDSTATYYGGTPQNERQAIIEQFQDEASPLRFFVGQPKTGGFGLTLTAATTVIYFSNAYDLEIRLQSEDRPHRIGQTKPVTYIDLVSTGTIDDKVLTALRNKINISSEVLGEKAREWLI